jgi:hypothetical protein
MVSSDTDDYYDIEGYYNHKDQVMRFFTSIVNDGTIKVRINGIDDKLIKLLDTNHIGFSTRNQMTVLLSKDEFKYFRENVLDNGNNLTVMNDRYKVKIPGTWVSEAENDALAEPAQRAGGSRKSRKYKKRNAHKSKKRRR